MWRVLIVEDEVIIRNALVDIAKHLPGDLWEVEEAEDGAEGIRVARKFQPHILLTDIKMPGISGLDMIDAIKKFLPETKFVILSGYNDFEFAQNAIRLQVSSYLLKPFTDE